MCTTGRGPSLLIAVAIAMLIAVLIDSGECRAAGRSLWAPGGLTPHQQKVYARTGHLTRSVRHNPAQTLWMKRYTERDATYYSRVYDYRALYDYPWHVRPPKWALHGWDAAPEELGEAATPLATPEELAPAPLAP